MTKLRLGAPEPFSVDLNNSTNGAIKVKLLSAINTRFIERLMWAREDVVNIWQRFMICQFILFVVSTLPKSIISQVRCRSQVRCHSQASCPSQVRCHSQVRFSVMCSTDSFSSFSYISYIILLKYTPSSIPPSLVSCHIIFLRFILKPTWPKWEVAWRLFLT